MMHASNEISDTGFFGQNFGWMVSRVDCWPMFLGLDVRSEIVALLALLAFFRRYGWFSWLFSMEGMRARPGDRRRRS
jgi:hypothetical protein